jgi:DNA processing protein
MELRTLCGRDEAYPPLLAQLHDPPLSLYVRGSAEVLREPAVAIVGARSCSAYGSQVARSVARELAAAGVVVVSGLARGIDGEAHRGALDAGGPTVAVLGCGIDRDYPRSHAGLAERIRTTGAVVSEYPPGTEPAAWRFPARNRIIAGLCLATVVVEARERSGALITADFALELGREVFAVPGEITSALSAGTNDLLRQGASPLLTPGDVLCALGLEPPDTPPPAVSAAGANVLRLLTNSAHDFDGIVRATGRSSAEVAAALVELELAGLVAEAEGIYRCRITAGRSPALPQPA